GVVTLTFVRTCPGRAAFTFFPSVARACVHLREVVARSLSGAHGLSPPRPPLRGRVEGGRGGVSHAQLPRFPSPLIEPDVRISRIRLSDWFHGQAPGRGPRRTRRYPGGAPRCL